MSAIKYHCSNQLYDMLNFLFYDWSIAAAWIMRSRLLILKIYGSGQFLHVCWSRVPPPTKHDSRCYMVEKETMFRGRNDAVVCWSRSATPDKE